MASKKIVLHNFVFDNENPLSSLIKGGFLKGITQNSSNIVLNPDISIDELNLDEIRDQESGILGIKSWKKLLIQISLELQKYDYRKFFNIFIGGDCGNLVGFLGHLASKNIELGLISFDAHPDYFLPDESESGGPADLEIALITGRGPDEITKMFTSYPIIKEQNILLLGLRDLGNLPRSEIRFFSCSKMKERTFLSTLMERLGNFKDKKIATWLHLDVDVLDPKEMPVTVPIVHGLLFNELTEICLSIIKKTPIIGISVGCYHPSLDKTGKATEKLAEFLNEILKIIDLNVAVN